MSGNHYSNEKNVNNTARKNRQRAWSDSTCTTLLSSSDSESSIRNASIPNPSSILNRPLPAIPKEQPTPVPENFAQKTSFHRADSSTKNREKISKLRSRRQKLIYLSIACVVFSIFCVSLVVVTFYRHGILPWDDVVILGREQSPFVPCTLVPQNVHQNIYGDTFVNTTVIMSLLLSNLTMSVLESSTSKSPCQKLGTLNADDYNNRVLSNTTFIVNETGWHLMTVQFHQTDPESSPYECKLRTFNLEIYQRTTEDSPYCLLQRLNVEDIRANSRKLFTLAAVMKLTSDSTIQFKLIQHKANHQPDDIGAYLNLVHLI